MMEVKERMGSKIVKLTTASVRIVILTMVLVLASSSWSVLGFTIDRDVTVVRCFFWKTTVFGLLGYHTYTLSRATCFQDTQTLIGRYTAAENHMNGKQNISDRLYTA